MTEEEKTVTHEKKKLNATIFLVFCFKVEAARPKI